MTTAREDIIGSIRRNLAASKPFDAVHNEHGTERAETIVNTALVVSDTVSQDQLLDNFCASAGLLGVHVEIASDARDGTALTELMIDRTGAKRIAISNSALVREVLETVETVEFTRNASTQFLFDSDLGITSAQWAIAETGTLVLEAESEDHRLISLVPPVHLCLLEASKIRQTLGEVLELTASNLGPAITFVTGASRTSDIELTLAIGVHGPGELHIIILADR